MLCVSCFSEVFSFRPAQIARSCTNKCGSTPLSLNILHVSDKLCESRIDQKEKNDENNLRGFVLGLIFCGAVKIRRMSKAILIFFSLYNIHSDFLTGLFVYPAFSRSMCLYRWCLTCATSAGSTRRLSLMNNGCDYKSAVECHEHPSGCACLCLNTIRQRDTHHVVDCYFCEQRSHPV